jgi:hypothetical protein
MATPFVQGRLRGEHLSVTIETVCHHCGQAMRLAVDSNMAVSVHAEGAAPLLFMPQINWASFAEPNIIDAY